MERTDGLDEYRAVVARVEAFAAVVSARRSADLQCRAGCDSCCHVELEVSPVEAAAVRAHLRSLDEAEVAGLAARARDRQGGRCVMLDAAGRCSIYDARPLVCRTQGLPLRYPAGFVPSEAIGLHLGEKGDATWCPLNFRERKPAGEDVLDAELVDRLLAVVNQRFSTSTGQEALERVSLRLLAGGA